jgi:hypothetical protein
MSAIQGAVEKLLVSSLAGKCKSRAGSPDVIHASVACLYLPAAFVPPVLPLLPTSAPSPRQPTFILLSAINAIETGVVFPCPTSRVSLNRACRRIWPRTDFAQPLGGQFAENPSPTRHPDRYRKLQPQVRLRPTSTPSRPWLCASRTGSRILQANQRFSIHGES